MAASKIEWTGHTWNPFAGCAVLSPGCTNCYAMKMAARLDAMGQPLYRGLTKPSKAGPVWRGTVRASPDALLAPLRRKKPTTYFVNSMSDLFYEKFSDEMIDRVFAVMALTPQHTYQVLTKRAERMRRYVSDCSASTIGAGDVCTRVARAMSEMGFQNSPAALRNHWPFNNVWLGVSTERQPEADERIPHLLQTPAAVRFISAEPLLGPIDLTRVPSAYAGELSRKFTTWDALRGTSNTDHPVFGAGGVAPGRLDWIIVGGESGPGARPMHPQWARDLRDQCKAAGVPFFLKQWGAWWPQECNPIEVQRFSDRLKIAGISPSRDRPERGCWDATGAWRPGSIAGGPPAYTMWKLGKKAAGRLLDGVEHNAMPGRVA